MCLSLPGKVLSISSPSEHFVVGDVDFDGVIREINLSLIPDVLINQIILVHAGFGIRILPEERPTSTSTSK